MKVERIADVVGVCKMLGDPTRVSIVALLANRPTAVGELCRELNLPQPSVSYHLALLRMTGLVNAKPKGKQRLYALNRDTLKPVKNFLAKLT